MFYINDSDDELSYKECNINNKTIQELEIQKLEIQELEIQKLEIQENEQSSDDDSDLEDTAKIKKSNLKKFIGKNKVEDGIYISFDISIDKLIKYINSQVIVIPSFQRILDENKVEQMYNAFKQDDKMFKHITNSLQFVSLNNCDSYINIDGQHRLKMYEKLYLEGYRNNLIRCTKINCTTEIDMYNIYNKLQINNKDIYDMNEINDIVSYNKYIELRDHLKNSYKTHFISNTTNEYIYNIEEYVNILKQNNFLNNHESVEDAIKYHEFVNNKYLQNYNDISIYTTIEQKRISASIIFTLKKNNFLDFLLYPDKHLLSFQHQHKLKKINKKKVKK